jgi:thymidylate synthase (FAD)
MKLVKPQYEILSEIDGDKMLKFLERIGRVCYKSEDKIAEDSAANFIRRIVASGHESVIEHEKVTVLLTMDRIGSQSVTRHRIASFSQESTRFCNYSKEKFGGHVQFIIPGWLDFAEEVWDLKRIQFYKMHHTTRTSNQDIDVQHSTWLLSMWDAEQSYYQLLKTGWTPEEARAVLPFSLKTEIVVTANLREWRTIFKQRTSKKAHKQLRELMVPLLAEFQQRIPVIFDDLSYETKKCCGNCKCTV